jgi:hypothetical protein
MVRKYQAAHALAGIIGHKFPEIKREIDAITHSLK